MAYIVDRRLNSKNKSLVNRERFLKRYQQQIRKAVSDAVSRRTITDMEQGESIPIPRPRVTAPWILPTSRAISRATRGERHESWTHRRDSRRKALSLLPSTGICTGR